MSFGIWELLVILLIIALLFGTKKLRSIGGDFGSAVKGFRSAMKEDDKEGLNNDSGSTSDGQVIDGKVESESETVPRKT